MNFFKLTVCFPLSKTLGRGFSITKENGQKYQASPALLKA
jgi:hypothetical protein